MTKKELIDEYLTNKVPVQGTKVKARGINYMDVSRYVNCTVHSYNLKDKSITVVSYGYVNPIKVGFEDWELDTYLIGANPFIHKPWQARVKRVNYDLGSILHSIGYEKRSKSSKDEIPELEWNPYFLTSGVKTHYQRGFVWTVDDQKLLIDSIYNGIDIGKIMVRKHDTDKVLQCHADGDTIAFKDIVDGKQRLNAILGFVTNEFSDSKGNYFSELSDQAQRMFFDFNAVSYSEIGEQATDLDVKNIFLNVNFTGVQMSQSHIEYVKSIEL